jgi:hypothetical protein
MSKYLVNKFLYSIDRESVLVARYKADPAGTVAWWETERSRKILNLPDAEGTTDWLAFTDAERTALATHDHVALFEMGAHPFLTLTLWIAMFEDDFDEPPGQCSWTTPRNSPMSFSPTPTSAPEHRWLRAGHGAGLGRRV